MMKKSVKPILSVALVAAFALSLTSCTKNETPAPAPTPSVSAGQSTATPSPSSIPTTQAPVTPDTKAYTGNELEEAKNAFPDIEVDEGVDKEQVQLALFGGRRYINSIYNSGYLANGSWYKNGASSQELVELYGRDWSDTYRAKLEAIIDELHNGPDQAAQNKAAEELMIHFFYFTKTEGMEVPADCNTNNVGVASCLVGGNLKSDTPFTYRVDKTTGKIYVDAKFDVDMRFIKDGVEGISSIHYDVQLEMLKNPTPDAENLRFAYIVNDIGGSWNLDNWHEGESK